MGEIAEMMLDGTLCEGCGSVLINPGEEPCGFPNYCSPQCARDRNATYWIEGELKDEKKG